MPRIQIPPFKMTPAIVSLVADIAEAVGSISADPEIISSVRLRKINRIRTIHGSLAIEGNTLTEEQITAVLDGKRILAPPREVSEARNAIRAYGMLDDLDPRARKDLLACHRTMMKGLLKKPGTYRTGAAGVMGSGKIIHLAPPADRVPFLVKNLFEWIKKSGHHPLITSSVFHYEFEFIHPFPDGNGRMGRLWQTLLLAQWNPAFSAIPVESLVHEHQADYYSALNKSSQQGTSTPFISFMLGIIRDAVSGIGTPDVTPDVTPEVKKLLKILKNEMSLAEIRKKLRLKDDKNLRYAYLRPAMDAGLAEMTIPEKPRSRLQKYRLTALGRTLDTGK